MNKKLEKVDRQIGLANRAKSAAKRKTSKDIRAELGDWRREKEELNAKQRQEQLAKVEAEKAKLKRKQEEERNQKKELVEEFKFQREMQKQL